MVLNAVFEHYAPSARGLQRDGIAASPHNAREFYRESAMESAKYSSRVSMTMIGDDSDEFDEKREPLHQQPIALGPHVPAATKQRKKRCRASKVLSSVAADMDIMTDWVFYYHTILNDREHRQLYGGENQEVGTPPRLIPSWLLMSLLIVNILGTFMWMIVATDGAVVAPLLRRLGVDKLSMGYALFMGVLIEDIPQVVLTFLIEDYYEDDQSFNNFAVISVVTSLYDTLIKLAESYDERGDFVETGVWCKESIWGHKKTVSSVIFLPMEDSSCLLSMAESRRSSVHVDNEKRRRKGMWSVLEEARQLVADTKLPRLRFLSTSLDKTARLWDTRVDHGGKWKCTKKIKDQKGILCATSLGDNVAESQLNIGMVHEGHMFLTGSKDGSISMWNMLGEKKRTFLRSTDQNVSATSLDLHQPEKTFVSAYADGVVREWDIVSGICLTEYDGHVMCVNVVRSMGDERTFLSAGNDAVIRLWESSQFDSTCLPETVPTIEKISKKCFIGHNAPILALVCVEPGVAFLSGSMDATARLWSVESGQCIRIFAGHTGPVSAAAIVDTVTFLTGSHDATIKVWDAFTGACIRTYTGHTKPVTALTTGETGTFISGSEDCTIKLWIFTALSRERSDNESDTDDDNGGCCIETCSGL